MTATDNPFRTEAGMKIHGEIVSWECGTGGNVPYATVLSALTAAGFDAKVARRMLPRNAFARATGILAEKRIIRKLSEDTATMRFQFTAEERDLSGDRLNYNYEAVLTLDKVTGVVTSADSPALAARAQTLIATIADERTPSDVTRIVQMLFEFNADNDLFPVRKAGGCYFVPQRHADLLDRMERFLTDVGGSLRRFPVPAGTRQGDKSVAESVTDGVESLLAEYTARVGDFDADSRDSTLERHVERLNQVRFKIESYAEFLVESRDELMAGLEKARAALRLKVAELGRKVQVPGEKAPEEAQDPLGAPETTPAASGPAGEVAAAFAAVEAEMAGV